MFIKPSFKKSLIVEQFPGNYLKSHFKFTKMKVMILALHGDSVNNTMGFSKVSL